MSYKEEDVTPDCKWNSANGWGRNNWPFSRDVSFLFFFQIKLAPGGRVTWQTTARPSPLRLFFQDQGRPWSAIFPSPITCLITIINIFLRWTLESQTKTRISLTLGAHILFLAIGCQLNSRHATARGGIRKWIYLNSVRMKGEEKLQVSYFFFLCCIEEEAFGDASLVQRTRQIVLKREWRSAWPAVENGARQMVARENKNECNYHTCWTTLQSPFGFRNIKRNIKQNKKEEGSIKLKSSR